MSHYKNAEIYNINDLHSLFPNGKADKLNWCIFSTSGVHGTYSYLDEIEHSLRNRLKETHPDYCSPRLTVLVIKPRMVSLGYGNIEILLEDIPFLRGIARTSLDQIAESQTGNI